MSAGNSGIEAVMDFYNNVIESKSDPRTQSWLLVGSPMPLMTILVTYLYFCISAGPRYMRDRKPYELKFVIQIYNVVQVVLSTYLVYLGIKGGWGTGYKFACEPVDYSDNPQAMTMATGVWVYYMCKIMELLDTVFFVLRKKSNQISFLHLYHHTLMPVSSWIGIKFLAGGHGTFLGVINSFIHIVMYLYYFLASLGPEYQKYLWWKKHLTAMQMVQFSMVLAQNVTGLMTPNCPYPKSLICLLGTQAVFFLYLFGSFYYRSYMLPKRQVSDNNNKSNDKTKDD